MFYPRRPQHGRRATGPYEIRLRVLPWLPQWACVRQRPGLAQGHAGGWRGHVAVESERRGRQYGRNHHLWRAEDRAAVSPGQPRPQVEARGQLPRRVHRCEVQPKKLVKLKAWHVGRHLQPNVIRDTASIKKKQKWELRMILWRDFFAKLKSHFF